MNWLEYESGQNKLVNSNVIGWLRQTSSCYLLLFPQIVLLLYFISCLHPSFSNYFFLTCWLLSFPLCSLCSLPLREKAETDQTVCVPFCQRGVCVCVCLCTVYIQCMSPTVRLFQHQETWWVPTVTHTLSLLLIISRFIRKKETDDMNHKELHVLLNRKQDTHVSACHRVLHDCVSWIKLDQRRMWRSLFWKLTQRISGSAHKRGLMNDVILNKYSTHGGGRRSMSYLRCTVLCF